MSREPLTTLAAVAAIAIAIAVAPTHASARGRNGYGGGWYGAGGWYGGGGFCGRGGFCGSPFSRFCSPSKGDRALLPPPNCLGPPPLPTHRPIPLPRNFVCC